MCIDAFEDVPNDDECRHLKADLIHHSMEKMLSLLSMALEQGLEMWCPDIRLHRVFPRMAAYTTDWPEQNLQCCTLEGSCLICKTAHQGQGDLSDEIELRKWEETLIVLRMYVVTKNKHHLKQLGLKEVWLWWGDMPDVNLPACITPDLLHQAYQGLFKTHLIRWMKEIIGIDKLDDWFAAMPQAEGLSHYPNGISAISSNRWTGSMSKQLIMQFLPAVVGLLEADMREMVHRLIDFMYRAQAPSLTESDLDAMDNNLCIFHHHKGLLVGPVYDKVKHFDKIAKLHMLQHWTHAIRELGDQDDPPNDFEDADEAGLEDVISHELCGDPESLGIETADDESNTQLQGSMANSTREVEDKWNIVPEPVYYPNPRCRMAKTPTVKKLSIHDVVDRYRASNIISNTADFLMQCC
ncbi:hypothetical protein FRC11_009383 [Ceratobasidium sp. 423]|nr:hypothetical protein FRC11_009383 [Ceratobasidium sp. 423]